MKKNLTIIDLSQNLFWDTEPSTIDIDKNSAFVIERVLEYGQWEDWKKIKEYYTLEKIKDVAINLRSLEPSAMSFIATITHTSLEEFRCFKLIQSSQQPWQS